MQRRWWRGNNIEQWGNLEQNQDQRWEYQLGCKKVFYPKVKQKYFSVGQVHAKGPGFRNPVELHVMNKRWRAEPSRKSRYSSLNCYITSVPFFRFWYVLISVFMVVRLYVTYQWIKCFSTDIYSSRTLWTETWDPQIPSLRNEAKSAPVGIC